MNKQRAFGPSPEQVEKWRKEFVDFGWSAYLRVKTEQATEIVELKAKLAGAEAEIAALKQGLRRADQKLAEVMPLAKFGALTATNGTLNLSDDAYKSGVFKDSNFLCKHDNIEATITKLLRD
jgi:hypothetical protein